MRRWLHEFRGAFLTWAAVPAAVVLFALMAIMWAVSAGYHPMAPIAFQGPFLLALVIITLLALFFLVGRHSSKARRALVWRNLGELVALAAGFVLASALIMVVITGPKTQTLVLFGENYAVPTAYRPSVSQHGVTQGKLLVLSVCGPLDAPVYEVINCSGPALVRYGNEDFLQEFGPGQTLEEAGARIIDETLDDLGRHQTGTEPGEIIYRQGSEEMRLWIDRAQRVELLRICGPVYRVDCTAMVRVGQRTIVFPVHDLQATSSKAGLMAAAKLWVAKIESWRCDTGRDCMAKTP